MMIMQLDNAWTLVAAMATILLGMRIHRVLPMLDRANIPPAVSAGLLLSVLLALLRAGGIVDVRLATVPRDVLLLVFFASLGFGAHLGRLATAGKSALVICLAVVLVAVGQNLAGMLLASAFGQPAVLGLFAGSAAYLGGHGTATAWASAAHVEGALELGLGSATLGLVLGGLVAGPVAAWLARRAEGVARAAGAPDAAQTAPDAHDAATPVRASPFSSDRWLLPLLGLFACVAAGPQLRVRLAAQGWPPPAFLLV